MTPTYGGFAIFGVATSVEHIPNANAQQIAAFFGVQGVQSLMGGGRGRAFGIDGLLVGSTTAGVRAAESALLTYADGLARTLTDTTGSVWPNVVFHAEYQPTSKFMSIPSLGLWGMTYKAVFRGLT